MHATCYCGDLVHAHQGNERVYTLILKHRRRIIEYDKDRGEITTTDHIKTFEAYLVPFSDIDGRSTSNRWVRAIGGFGAGGVITLALLQVSLALATILVAAVLVIMLVAARS